MFPTATTCLLCESLLQPDDENTLTTHLSDQHKVVCNLEFIMVASKMVEEEINQVMEIIKKFEENRRDTALDSNNLILNCKEELPFIPSIDNCFKHTMEEGELKTELSEHVHVVKKEYEEEVKPLKKKRGIKKGSSILGSVDKKTLPQTPTLGPCKCPLCKKQFDVLDMESEKQYRRHLYVHRVRKFDCQCDKTWETDKDLKLHIYKYHRGNFHCETCRQTYHSENKYEEHLAEDPHKEEDFVCDDCGFTSPNKATFYAHIKYHHDKDIKACTLCSKEFEGTFRLKLHMRTFHAEKKPCPLCGEMIKKMGMHMRTMHTKDSDKKYPCDLCGKGFAELGKLEIHKMSVHIKARPFVCRFGCGAATNDKGNRKKHEITKHGRSFDEMEGYGY